MLCEYCIVGSYAEACRCAKTGENCYFVRRCNNERKWKPLDSMEICKLRKDEVILKKDEYQVRFEYNGELYIEVGDMVIRKKNPYDYIPKIVKMVEVDGELEFKDFVPLQSSPKTVKTHKKNSTKKA